MQFKWKMWSSLFALGSARRTSVWFIPISTVLHLARHRHVHVQCIRQLLFILLQRMHSISKTLLKHCGFSENIQFSCALACFGRTTGDVKPPNSSSRKTARNKNKHFRWDLPCTMSDIDEWVELLVERPLYLALFNYICSHMRRS